jgi:putative acetyltransferase
MKLSFRPIAPADDPAVAEIIRKVMPEFGAVGPGFAINDPEVDFMSQAYSGPRAAYFVVTDEAGWVLGGAGVGPLPGAPDDVCELRKMYFLPETRGHGMGTALLRHCLATARELGFRRCYLETLAGMETAQRLYEKLGFQKTCAMGATGHHGCDRFYVVDL